MATSSIEHASVISLCLFIESSYWVFVTTNLSRCCYVRLLSSPSAPSSNVQNASAISLCLFVGSSYWVSVATTLFAYRYVRFRLSTFSAPSADVSSFEYASAFSPCHFIEPSYWAPGVGAQILLLGSLSKRTVLVQTTLQPITMVNFHICRFCSRSFSSSKALSCHIANKPACAALWLEFIDSLAPPSDIDPIPEDSPIPEEDDEMYLDAIPQDDPGQGLDDLEFCAEGQGLDDLFEDLVPIPEYDPSESPNSDSEDAEDDGQFEVPFESSGEIKGKIDPPFTEHISTQRKRGQNIYYPFSGSREWELVTWLHESGLSLTKIDRFLHLKYVRIFLNSILVFSLNVRSSRALRPLNLALHSAIE